MNRLSPQSKRPIAVLAVISSLVGSCRRAGSKDSTDPGDSFDSKRGAPVVHGAVTDLDGRGIAGVTVLVRRIGENVQATSQLTTVTDGSGQYIASLEAGPYWVEFRHPLYAREQRSLRFHGGHHRVDVRLFPPGSIRGRALSTSTDRGVAGAIVYAWQQVDELDVVMGSASTVADGSFTLSGLRPGGVRLTAVAGSLGTSQDVTLHVHRGEPSEMVDLRMTSVSETIEPATKESRPLPLETKGRLLGRVKDASGRLMANLSVQSEAASPAEDAKERPGGTEVGGYHRTGETDDEGRFELENLPMGRYFIELRDEYGQRAVRRSGERSYANFVAISARADAPLELETPACEGSLRGGVVDSQGRDVPYAKLTVERGQPNEPAFAAAKRSGAAKLLANVRGQFEVRELCEGSYTIRASSEDEELASKRNLVHPDEQVTIVVMKKATLAGTITAHGIPVRNFSMLAAGPTRIEQSIEAIEGAYRLSDFSPGEYELLISADEGYAREVLSVGNEAEIHRDFELRPWSAVRGLAVDRTGVPLAGIEIDLALSPAAGELDHLGPDVRFRRTTSTRLGRFAFERLPAAEGYITFVQAGCGLYVSETQFSTPFGTLLGPSPWLSFETVPGDSLDLGEIRVSTLAGP